MTVRGRIAAVCRACAALVVCLTFAGTAQVEAQTRADSAAVLLNAAEQLRLRGETSAARALLELIQRQYAGTPAATELDRVRSLLRRTPEAERSGRTELLVSGALYGAWLGVAAPLALDVDGPEGYGIGLLLGAPLGFFAARKYADAKMPTEGQTRALTFGGLWGTYQGFAIAELFDLGDTTSRYCPEPDVCFEETNSDAAGYVAAAVAGGLLGIGAGAYLARKPIPAGTAAAVTLGGMWGTWFGFGLAFMADQDGDGLLATTLVAGNAALLGMGLVAPRWQMGESRARLISVGGLAGGLAGAGLLLIAQPDAGNSAIVVPLIGSAAGLGLAAYWTRQRDDTDADGGLGALINRSGDRWGFDMPQAALRMTRGPDGGLEPAMHVPIARLHF